ncbi:MAG TPA: hypothetical protein VGJ19_24280 [Streptosporangiaceae bacterium]
MAMETGVMFVDCPAYLNRTGTQRCGLPAEVEDLYCLQSTDGPLDSARIRCPRGHWFNGPLEALVLDDRVRTVCGGMGARTGQTGQRLLAAGPPAGHAVGTGVNPGRGVNQLPGERAQALTASDGADQQPS